MSKPHQSNDSNANTGPIDSEKTVNNLDSSSADNVDRHLQTLESTATQTPQRQLSPEEQLFTEEELARLVNPDRLKALMSNGDDFLGYLTGEIDKFED